MIYNIGLIVVILTILISIDDLMWDLFFFFLKLFGKVKDPVKITKAQMLSVPPKMMALIIAAYREEDVIEEVLRNIIATNHTLMKCIISLLGYTLMTRIRLKL